MGLGDHKSGIKDGTARQTLRAEIDALVAHIYGLTEDEFVHILSTFPIIDQSIKDDTLEAYRKPSIKALVTPTASVKILSPLSLIHI